ncbi:GNAT family N-acetyltransferase [Vibrio sp. S9_S30]|uniref:GNAT family N-acetyltransferase n=1 Tax=Vibrio sp. S9_S30 TaxID=2720226 RepID=UPI00168173A2|nr:GNAT family N-acetyltransferase [Vibrio sp. S9_S30]MBD1558692.1 GNAT family N-acetyltransferase [Vibrio sp. S9_S30]
MVALMELAEKVSNSDILPHFSEERRMTFISKVLLDVKTAFDTDAFHRVKAADNDRVIGLGALREGSYITHLFVATEHQSDVEG